MNSEEKVIISQIKGRNRQTFDQLFQYCYEQRVRFAEGMLYEIDASKDIAQNCLSIAGTMSNLLRSTLPLKFTPSNQYGIDV